MIVRLQLIKLHANLIVLFCLFIFNGFLTQLFDYDIVIGNIVLHFTFELMKLLSKVVNILVYFL